MLFYKLRKVICLKHFIICQIIDSGWPPKLPKRINLPIFVPQRSPKRPPQTTQMGAPRKIWGRGQGTPVYPIFYLPKYMLANYMHCVMCFDPWN